MLLQFKWYIIVNSTIKLAGNMKVVSVTAKHLLNEFTHWMVSFSSLLSLHHVTL